ncbi:MAG: hypothetical protein GX654_19215, partial [Desulfatiglans sp.]|nr:hypothetical protein [Desulfatiglans sp.]
MMDRQRIIRFLLRRHAALILILLIFSLLPVDITAYGAEAGKNTVSKKQPVDQNMLKALPTGIDAGLYHTLYIKKDGTLWSVGYNNNGQLGDGTTDTRSTPIQVASDVAQVASGNAHSLFIKSDGTLWAMGYNKYGQLGDGTNTSRNKPVKIASDVIKVTAGVFHTLFIKKNGTLWGMGWNEDGQLGDGTFINKNKPVRIDNNVEQIAAGSAH